MTQNCRPWSEQDIAEVKEMAGKLTPKDPKRTQSTSRIPTRKLAVAPAEAMDDAAPETQTTPRAVETVIAPAAIERALTIYQQLQPGDQSVIVQARKILTQHLYGMVDRGERDEQRLTVGGLAHLKAVERERGIKSANGAGLSRTARSSRTGCLFMSAPINARCSRPACRRSPPRSSPSSARAT
jgi:hypothetical protein